MSFGCLAIFRISIPYGAIKSDDDILIAVPENKFQFLMVRLKDFEGY